MNYPQSYEGTVLRTTGKLPEHDGIGTLSQLDSCVCTMDADGGFTLDLSCSAAACHANDLGVDFLIRADLGTLIGDQPADRYQFFRIAQIQHEMTGGLATITVHAEHLSYDLNYSYVKPCKIRSKAPQDFVIHMKNHTLGRDLFRIECTIPTDTEYHTLEYTELFSKREGVLALAKAFGGGVIFSNQQIVIVDGGSLRDFSIEYGKNMAGFSYAADVTPVVDGVYVYYQSGEVFSLLDDPVRLADSPYGVPRYAAYNCAGQESTEPPLDILTDIGRAWLRQQSGDPERSFTAEVANMPRTPGLRLYDEIQVVYPPLGISEQARVVKIEYDVLRGKYLTVEAGSIRRDAADLLADLQRRE